MPSVAVHSSKLHFAPSSVLHHSAACTQESSVQISDSFYYTSQQEALRRLIALRYFFYNFNSISTYKPSPQFNTEFLNHKATEKTEIFLKCLLLKYAVIRHYDTLILGHGKRISQSCMAIATFPFMTNLRTRISLVQNLLENFNSPAATKSITRLLTNLKFLIAFFFFQKIRTLALASARRHDSI